MAIDKNVRSALSYLSKIINGEILETSLILQNAAIQVENYKSHGKNNTRSDKGTSSVDGYEKILTIYF